MSVMWLALAVGILAIGSQGLRGLRALREAWREAECDRLASPPHWPAVRALIGVLAAMPVLLVTQRLGGVAWIAGAAVAVFGFCSAPQFLAQARRTLERRLLDELAVHLDLLAVAMEAGGDWRVALGACIERAPDGPLRRAWQRVLLDIQGGMEPLDALRALEQRLRLQPLTTLLSALRAAEKLRMPAASVLRERARHCAAARFARAERRARAAPLKLWAAMLLCLVPCSAVVLAYPLARLLALLAE